MTSGQILAECGPMKYGFEREYFLKRGTEFVLAPANIPKDECGYLAEARGEPHREPMAAAFLMLAEESKLDHLAGGIQLLPLAYAELPPALIRAALRAHGKNSTPAERGNLYGLDYRDNDKTIRAGLHVHFSNEKEVTGRDGNSTVLVPQIFDFVKIIQRLDKAFKSEIKAAKRIPGLYEMKAHGVEYRSLPASVDPRAVARILESL